MKAKIIPLAVLCVLCLIMSGCDTGRKAEYRESYDVKPNMIIYGKDKDNIYFNYVVDKKTGVVYIIGDGYNWGGMAPAFNADGTLMLKDQLRNMRGAW